MRYKYAVSVKLIKLNYPKKAQKAEHPPPAYSKRRISALVCLIAFMPTAARVNRRYCTQPGLCQQSSSAAPALLRQHCYRWLFRCFLGEMGISLISLKDSASNSSIGSVTVKPVKSVADAAPDEKILSESSLYGGNSGANSVRSVQSSEPSGTGLFFLDIYKLSSFHAMTVHGHKRIFY